MPESESSSTEIRKIRQVEGISDGLPTSVASHVPLRHALRIPVVWRTNLPLRETQQNQLQTPQYTSLPTLVPCSEKSSQKDFLEVRFDRPISDLEHNMNPNDRYLETSVLTATPLELVAMLYRCALESLGEARRCLAQGDIPGRVRPVNRAFDAVTELSLSLDYDGGGQLSTTLGELYGYISHKIILGHTEQSDAHFAEAMRLLLTLLESWQGIMHTAAQNGGVAAAASAIAAA